MPASYLHGCETLEIEDGTRTIKTVKTVNAEYPAVYCGSVKTDSSGVVSGLYQPIYDYNFYNSRNLPSVNQGTVSSGTINGLIDRKIIATIGANTTINFPVNVPKGVPLNCEVKAIMGTTAYTITHPSVTWKFGSTPPTPEASKTYLFMYETDDGTNWTGYWTQEGA